jgi:murein L,D-transpeptidase YcbB/YkuD
VKSWIFGGAAIAALMGVAQPAVAATPALPTIGTSVAPSGHGAVGAFYASRGGAPLWLKSPAEAAAAREFISVLRRAPFDGLASGPALAAQAEALLARAASGDAAARTSAEQLLSTAWTLYVGALQSPPPGMAIADSWAAPRRDTPGQILARAAAAPSLAQHVRTVSAVNPVYAQLRDAAWNMAQASGGQADARVLASLDRARTMPFQKRYVMVDAASARLFMIEDGQIADSMKVIVGKAETQTPMVASTIYYATLNPYWNVPADLAQKLIAPRVLEQGIGYLKQKNYEVLSGEGSDAQLIDPASVDWKAVAAGTQTVRVRQLPGPANSMGRVKFGFPNANDIFLHDTPNKDLFVAASRDLSNGCIRLEDAPRLGRWLLGRDLASGSDAPEQHVLLPTPVPVFVTYLTAQGSNGQLSFVKDVYGRDSANSSQVAALR